MTKESLVDACVRATDDGDHHPPISRWAARQCIRVALSRLAAIPLLSEVTVGDPDEVRRKSADVFDYLILEARAETAKQACE